ncbi:hypothetical protein L3C95_30320 [Chitinophaga filiformis]|uniref:hypothetical protein n=1 Tax=Chitinophaga filiformis TaxID=104663 RepID=UPI001F25B380|nr:hypothetical protein [Chitinophaga filiformis]MCF6407229.1 hypothetical protein [Chitinophaga filiformis]
MKYIPLLLAVFFFACKKNDNAAEYERLTQWANASKINIVDVTTSTADLHIDSDSAGAMPSGYQRILLVTLGSTTREIPFTGSDITLTDLERGNVYELRIKVVFGVKTYQTDRTLLETDALEYDYARIYYDRSQFKDWQLPYSDSNMIFRSDFSQLYVYGPGVGERVAKFVNRDNPLDSVEIKSTQLGETTSIIAWSKWLPAEPYVQYKYYYLVYGKQVLNSYYGWKHNVKDTAYFKVFNTSHYISSASYTPSSGSNECGLLTLKGFFGSDTPDGSTVNFDGELGQRLGGPWDRSLVIQQNGVTVKTIQLTETDAGTCESGVWISNKKFSDEGIYYYHNIEDIIVKISLPSGTYSIHTEAAMRRQGTKFSQSYELKI